MNPVHMLHGDEVAVLGLAHLQHLHQVAVDQPHQQGRVLAEVLDARDLAAATVIRLIEVVAAIDSDYEKAQTLKRTARLAREDEQIREAYLEAADTIDSDTDYGRVMKAVRR